jgi:hypothetical protein
MEILIRTLLLAVLLTTGTASGQEEYASESGWSGSWQQEIAGSDEPPAPEDAELAPPTSHQPIPVFIHRGCTTSPVAEANSTDRSSPRIRAPPFS